MIIGNGLIARSIEPVNNENVILFCSGVSNSLETNANAFEREISLLQKCNSELPLVYFSTISIFNTNKSHSPYILHKLRCERLIEQHFKRYYILRLPNMVALDGNPNNLFPYFYNSILNHSSVIIYKNAHRHLMHVSDLPILVNSILSHYTHESVILNCCYKNPPTAEEIYLYMCKQLKQNANFSYGEKEIDYYVNNSSFLEFIDNFSHSLLTDWKKMIDDFVSYKVHLQS